MHVLQESLLTVIKNKFTQDFLDCSKNGVLERWKKNKTSHVETANHFTILMQFGMHCVQSTSILIMNLLQLL